MKYFAIYCPSEDDRKNARRFFTTMFKDCITKNTNDRIETSTGITIMYVSDKLHTCGMRITDFISVGAEDNTMCDILRICKME